MTAINRYRSIWISDVHLGTKGCKAEFLFDFLRHNDSDHLYLVGDIIDGWSLKRSWYWTQHHNDVIQKVLRKARKGTRVTYIPGNHDEFARGYVEHLFGGIRVVSNAIHTTATGKRFLVLHGDEFDGIVTCARWLAVLGSRSYECALLINRWFNHIQRRFGYPYWSLSAYLKQKVKNAVKFIENNDRPLISHRSSPSDIPYPNRGCITAIHTCEYHPSALFRGTCVIPSRQGQ